mmetsp:Transcript_24356/g.35735  ORF Transcript_24356/g.35735 Transcript_24356/m.35735 type:complete len:396 (+) Transcript_24356:115-1302(+)|eukprot:CAMPEP_0185029458 /NCGR_PEP_ID=MMETSP1103-20130426/15765_1 /TAXON_ID=36769 /ORGANISM="Paraphysomonas bandaiensis, Strain Caron Lab Isolate" /LENGTH=395 /DNA_ID=CAMNT_0027564209 /DNA_START=67 /DNA_END=1254 /DNA_ORIENTATION=-
MLHNICRIGAVAAGSMFCISPASSLCDEAKKDFVPANKLLFSSASSLRPVKKKKEATSAALVIVSGTCHPKLSKEIADILGVSLHHTEISRFADGEVKIELESIRGGNVFVVQPCGNPVSDSSMELLLAISAAKRAGAKKVTAVMPYYPFKHHRRGMPRSNKHKSKFLISAAMDFAKMLQEMGTDRVVTVDLQRPGQGQEACFFDNSIPLENIVTTKLISDYFLETVKLEGNTVVISPNYECMNKAVKYESRLQQAYPDANVTLSALVHHGISAHKQSTDLEALGKLEVEGANVVIIDDIIDSGETISYIANRVKNAGAKRVFAIAFHGVFTVSAMQVIDRSPIEKVIVTNSLPLPAVHSSKIEQVSVAPLLAQVIWTEQYKSRTIDEEYEIEFH